MPRPDEGLIHAWLDGQLPPDEAARVEQLAAADPEWDAAVAEARGLIAASSRILSSLDHAPAGVIPKRDARQPAWRMPWWTKVAAAVVVVAGGSLFVIERANVATLATTPMTKPTEPVVGVKDANVPVAAQAPVATAPAVKKSAPSPAPAAALMAGAQPTTEAADRAMPAMPPALRSKDVAAKAADVAPGTVAQAAPNIGGITALRAVGGAAMKARAAEPAGAGTQDARRVSEVAAAPAPTSMQSLVSRCYRVRDPNAPVDAGIVMRMVSTDGDTLRLESSPEKSGLRAWIVWRDGLGHGALTTADGKGAVAIVATASACPTP